MNEDVGREIAALGLAPERARRLLLLPLAYVAAASRRRDLALLDRLIESSVGAAQIDGMSALQHGKGLAPMEAGHHHLGAAGTQHPHTLGHRRIGQIVDEIGDAHAWAPRRGGSAREPNARRAVW